MSGQIIIPVDANAAEKVFDLSGNCTLSIIGLVTTETVAVQIPRVASPIEATDEHWTALVVDGDEIALSVTNNAIMLPSRLDQVRLVKAAGVDENAYGVKLS